MLLYWLVAGTVVLLLTVGYAAAYRDATEPSRPDFVRLPCGCVVATGEPAETGRCERHLHA